MRKNLVAILLLVCVLSACQFKMLNNHDADGNSVRIKRYDRLQFEYVATRNLTALQLMNTEYPQATKMLIEDVLALGEVNYSGINEAMLEYFNDTTLMQLVLDTQDKFKDLTSIEKELSVAFARLHKEVPQLPIPTFYSQISALNQSIVVNDTLIGISLDKYLGADYEIYKRFYYDYQSRTMASSRIVPDCLTFYLLSRYPYAWMPGRTLLDVMMDRGKIHWVVAKLLKQNGEEQMAYTDKETKWCRKNRKHIWNNMIKNGHLYATDPLIVRSYLRAESYRQYFGDATPPLIGIWMGMQLIDKYMKLHPEKTIAQLLGENNYIMMLTEIDFEP